MAKKNSKLAKRAAELEAAVAGLFTGKPGVEEILIGRSY